MLRATSILMETSLSMGQFKRGQAQSVNLGFATSVIASQLNLRLPCDACDRNTMATNVYTMNKIGNTIENIVCVIAKDKK